MDRRTVCIKIMDILDEWNEDNGFETSAAMDMEVAGRIYDEAIEPNIKKGE